jgi:hypothetical protein
MGMALGDRERRKFRAGNDLISVQALLQLMSSLLHPLSVFPEQPAFGAAQFIGRARLAQNVLSRCRRGESIVLYGGHKLGKTSLLLHLKWLADQDCHTSAATSPTIYMDLTDEAARRELVLGARPAPIVLFDNCDHLLNEYGASTLQKVMQRDTLAHATIWAGSRGWHDAVLAQIEAVPLRRVPLAVLFESDAFELLKLYLPPDQLPAVRTAGGTHPYVLKVIAHELQSGSTDPKDALHRAAERLIPFFQVCCERLQQREQTLLRYLVQEARPVAPQEAARAVGLSSIKSTADVLCWLGLISRWNREEGAVLHANCQLFNDWYGAHGPAILEAHE